MSGVSAFGATLIAAATAAAARAILGAVSLNGDAMTGGLVLSQGTGAPGTAGLKIASAPLLLTPEAGAFERLADSLYLTISTGTARKPVVLADSALTSGQIPFATTNGRIAGATTWTRNPTTGHVIQTYNAAGANIYQLTNTNASTGAQAYMQFMVDATSWYFGAESNAGSLSPGGAYIYCPAAKPLRIYTAGVQRLEVSGAGVFTSAAAYNIFNNYGKFGAATVGTNTLLAVGRVAGNFGLSTAAAHFVDDLLSATVNFQNTNPAGYTAFDLFDSAGVKVATYGWSNASAALYPGALWNMTRTAADVIFGTNSTERLRITAAGAVQVASSLTIGASGTAITQTRVYTPSLTPALVSAGAPVEQTFAVAGLATSDTISVNAPGMAIFNARVSAADTLALTFFPPAAGSYTPPAGVYRIIAHRS